MKSDIDLDAVAGWLYKYRSYNNRPNAWRQLKEEDPKVAEMYRKDAAGILKLIFQELGWKVTEIGP